MRALKYVAYTLVFVAVIWTAAWHAAEPIAEWRAAAAMERLAERGVEVEIADIAISGFPIAFNVTVTGVKLRDPARRMALDIPSVQAAYTLAAPMQAELRLAEPIAVLRGEAQSRLDLQVGFEGFVARLSREAAGVYMSDASAERVRIDVSDAGSGRVTNAELTGWSAKARLDETARSVTAQFAAPMIAVVDAQTSEAPARIEMTDLVGELTAEIAGVRLETRLARLQIADSDVAAVVPALTLAAFAPAPSDAGGAPAPPSERPSAGGGAGMRALAAEMFAGGGAFESLSTVAQIDVQRTLPAASAPLRSYAFSLPDAVSELRIERDAISQQTRTGPIAFKTTSVAPDGAAFDGLDGEIARLEMRGGAPITPGEATGGFALIAGPITYADAALQRAFGQDPPALADDQGVRLSAEVQVSIDENPLMRALGAGAGSGADGPPVDMTAVRLTELRAALLDMEFTAEGEMRPEARGPAGQAAIVMRNWRPFLQRVASLGLFDRALVNVMSLTIGAFAQSAEEPGVSTVDVELQPGAVLINGRRMKLPG